MPRIAAVATANPPYKVQQAEVRERVAEHFRFHIRRVDRLLGVFDNAGIDERYLARPVEWLGGARSLSEKNRAYIETCVELCSELIARICDETRGGPESFDAIVFVSTTGLATPTIDAHLANAFPFRSDIRRLPVWGLGCAGGVAGLAHAWSHARANPGHRVLLLAAELCSLTFLADDYSTSNLVATALFGDGAAAVVVEGDECAAGGLEIVAAGSRLHPRSLDLMSWNVVDHGLQVVFSRRIPAQVRAHGRAHTEAFLSQNGVTCDALDAWILHPGGPKVLDAYESALGLERAQTALSRHVLRRFGNMSSPSVLFALDRYLTTPRAGLALLSAVGPGFSSEFLLVRGAR